MTNPAGVAAGSGQSNPFGNAGRSASSEVSNLWRIIASSLPADTHLPCSSNSSWAVTSTCCSAAFGSRSAQAGRTAMKADIANECIAAKTRLRLRQRVLVNLLASVNLGTRSSNLGASGQPGWFGLSARQIRARGITEASRGQYLTPLHGISPLSPTHR
jgi:hypothetical protein